MDNNEIFDTAIDFITNGAELPDIVKDDPKSVFLAACLRELNQRGLANKQRSEDNETSIKVLKGLGIFSTLSGGSAILLLVLNYIGIV